MARGHRQVPCQVWASELVSLGEPSWGFRGVSVGVSDDETVKDVDWEIGTVFGKCVEVNVQNCVGGGESD